MVDSGACGKFTNSSNEELGIVGEYAGEFQLPGKPLCSIVFSLADDNCRDFILALSLCFVLTNEEQVDWFVLTISVGFGVNFVPPFISVGFGVDFVSIFGLRTDEVVLFVNLSLFDASVLTGRSTTLIRSLFITGGSDT